MGGERESGDGLLMVAEGMVTGSWGILEVDNMEGGRGERMSRWEADKRRIWK